MSLKKQEYRSFEEARAFVQKLGFKSSSKWMLYSKGHLPKIGLLPEDIPKYPNVVYKDQGWQGIGDWIGTGAVAPKNKRYRPFSEARTFVRELGLKGQSEWEFYSKGLLPEKGSRPEDIPGAPWQYYKNQGWLGIRDWLGISYNILTCYFGLTKNY